MCKEPCKKAHKHAELIKQWAEGAQIQYLSTCDCWVDCVPTWERYTEYRVKPEQISLSYRVALMKSEGIFFTQSTDSNNYLEKHFQFVRWLTKWIEVEV